MTINSQLTTELQKLAPDAMIELFELDCTSLGGDLLRFHAGTNELKGNIVWQGNTYVRYPVQVTGFEFNGQGQFPRPKMMVSNFMSAITTILMQFDDLIGSKVTRKRTMKKFLDAVNFEGGTNPTADDTVEFEDDVYFIDRKSLEDRDTVEFELASAMDLMGIQLPRRQVVQNVCPWVYRGSECGFTGPPIYDQNDEQLTTATTAEGQAVIDTYADYLAAQAELDAAEAVLTTEAQAMNIACQFKALESRYEVSITGNTINSIDYAVRISFFGTIAYWNATPVVLGSTYKRGAYRRTLVVSGVDIELYEIERWGVDSGCSDATDDYNDALSDRNTKLAARDSAQSDYMTALDDLPADDPLYRGERCGKRLTSCKARFGEDAELPYGGFPSVGLFR